MFEFVAEMGEGKMNVGPWAANVSRLERITAGSFAEARAKATDMIGVKSHATGGVARSVRRVDQVRTWAVTLKGKDKRKRKTWVVKATCENDAIQAVGYMHGVYAHAGTTALWSKRAKADGVVVSCETTDEAAPYDEVVYTS